MTALRQQPEPCKAKPTDRTELYLLVWWLAIQTCCQSSDLYTIKRELRDLSRSASVVISPRQQPDSAVARLWVEGPTPSQVRPPLYLRARCLRPTPQSSGLLIRCLSTPHTSTYPNSPTFKGIFGRASGAGGSGVYLEHPSAFRQRRKEPAL